MKSENNQLHILVVDDQADVLEALRLLLKGHGFDVDTVNSPAAALSALERRDYDAMLLDMNYTRDTTSGKEGLDLLAQLQSLEPDMPAVVMTAWGSIDNAVEAMRRGARDYIEKPWDNARLVSILTTQVELGRALRRAQRLETENRLLRRDHLPQMIAESPKMHPILQIMERVGPSDANVLITGEHGTGKELVAQWLHASSPRKARSFIAVNMGGLSEGLFESELFGHVKGSFTDAKTDRVGRFELADGGTLFLDEIGTVPLAMQSKLLRVLQTGDVERVGSSKARHVDVRIISATNTNLQQEVAEGRFREDLLFRLNTIEIQLPALRDRREDIPALATHFLRRHAARYRKTLHGFDAGAMQLLLTHPWPGNIRELDHAVERGVLLAQADQIRTADLGLRPASSATTRLEDLPLEDVEKMLIQKSMAARDRRRGRAMLDLDHPMSQHIFAAARAESAILVAARYMTVAARGERIRLRDGCAPAFTELRRLSHDHFADRRRISSAIDHLEQALAELAGLPGVPDDGPSAKYKCPACDADLERRGTYGFPAPDNPTDIYCSPCLKIIMPPLSTLRSIRDGFGTDAI